MTAHPQSHTEQIVGALVSTILDQVLPLSTGLVSVERNDSCPSSTQRGSREESLVSFQGPLGTVHWNTFLVNDFGCHVTSSITINSPTSGTWKQTFGGDQKADNRPCTIGVVASALAFALRSIQNGPSAEVANPLANLTGPSLP